MAQKWRLLIEGNSLNYQQMKFKINYKYLYTLCDLMILSLSFLISVFYLRINTELAFIDFYLTGLFILPLILLLSSFVILIFQYNGLYQLDIILKRSLHFATILKAIYFSALTIVLFSLALDLSGISDSRLMIFLFLLISIPAFLSFRVLFLRWFFLELSNTSFSRNVIIVGDGKAGRLLATKLMYENPIGINVLGFVDNDLRMDEFVVGGKKVLGNLEDLKTLTVNLDVDELVIAIDSQSNEEILSVIDYCKNLGVRVRVTSDLFEVVTRKIRTERYIDIPVINVDPKYNDRFTLTLKRIFDIFLSVFALILLSPLMILISILIKLSSPGAILFKQKRIGQFGKEFDFYKFRSMKPMKENQEDEQRKKMMIDFMKKGMNTGGDLKVVNEDRVTWIGKIIRKTSLDELPQLINVLRGEMSLVGPRPCLPYEFAEYDEWQKRRVDVIPGCTGVWQVLGRSSVSFNDSVVLDLYYINNMSPWLDLQLIFQTIPVMLFSKGAR